MLLLSNLYLEKPDHTENNFIFLKGNMHNFPFVDRGFYSARCHSHMQK